MRRPILQTILAASFLSVSGAALADAFTEQSCTDSGGFFSSVSVPNSKIEPFPSPYGEICVTLNDSNTATITADTFSPYLMGDGGSLALNFNGAVTIVGGNSGITGDAGTGPYSSGGAGNEDGFGSFNFSINDFDGFTKATSTLIFAVDLTSGSWASAQDVLTFNSKDFDAAMHIFVSGCTSKGKPVACATGFAGEGTGTNQEAPEPASVALLGMGFIGIALTRHRRKGER